MINIKSQQAGFTLIELIVVMVLIGALAAVAIPRFINQTTNARIAALNGLRGGLMSAAALAQAQLKATPTAPTGTTGTTSITMDSTSVVVAQGSGAPIATATGIGVALSSYSGFTLANPVAASGTTAGTVTFNFSPTAVTGCLLVYSDGQSTAGNTAATVTPTTTGC